MRRRRGDHHVPTTDDDDPTASIVVVREDDGRNDAGKTAATRGLVRADEMNEWLSGDAVPLILTHDSERGISGILSATDARERARMTTRRGGNTTRRCD